MLRKCTGYCKYCRKFPHLSDRKELKIYALINTRSTCYVSSIGLRNLMIPQAFADTPIGQSLLKLDESQRKRLENYNAYTLEIKIKWMMRKHIP
jgi:hypothetical protein